MNAAAAAAETPDMATTLHETQVQSIRAKHPDYCEQPGTSRSELRSQVHKE